MKKAGFTLIELLIVIAIIAILAAVTYLMINPVDVSKRSRDANRLIDLQQLQSAISIAVQEATGSGVMGVLCEDGGSSCEGASQTGTRNPDGTGWVKADLSVQKTVSVPTLPIDPINDAAYHYKYCAASDAWEIDAAIESENQKDKLTKDGGDDPLLYEVGPNLKLISPSGGSCTY